MTDDDGDRVTELEIKVSYQEKRIADLDDTLLAQSRRIDELESILNAVTTAMKRLRAEGEGKVMGSYPEEDPVPRSG